MVAKQSLIFALFWTLVCASVSGQEPETLPDPMRSYGRADAGAAEAQRMPDYLLSGTLISPSGRVAILNGQSSREGDRVDGAQILSIQAGAVRIRAGSGELTVYLGSNTAQNPSYDRSSRISRGPNPLQRSPEPAPAAGSVPSQALTARFDARGHHGPVMRGETLSGIAELYLGDGVTMNQMMIALFHANPEAFSGNINVLREGAVLRIPDGGELRRQLPEAATAEVARQQTDWLGSNTRQARLTEAPGEGVYGPVTSGETLSDIAERVSRDDVTMNQMMIALFHANPEAFSGNINVLHEGAVLRIPDGGELRRQVPETATAEVLRQTDAWRAGSWRQARLTTTPPMTQESHLTGTFSRIAASSNSMSGKARFLRLTDDSPGVSPSLLAPSSAAVAASSASTAVRRR